jgi:hypothetical protein
MSCQSQQWGVLTTYYRGYFLAPQSYQIMKSLLSKIKLIKTTKLNKHRDTELRGLGQHIQL